MNAIITLASLLLNLSSAQAAVKPDFKCLEQGGFRYEFFVRFGEIHIFNEKGQELDHLDSMRVEHLVLESNPPQDQYSFIYEEGNTVAVLNFGDGQKLGTGQMIDNDQSMICTR